MSEALKIAIGGALGRMGLAIAAAAATRTDVVIAARYDRPGAADTAFRLQDRDSALRACDVAIDFTTPAASAELAVAAADYPGLALVIGSTGLSAEQEAVIARAGRRSVIVRSGNFSIGVNVLAGLVEQAARRLGPELWDIEVFEAHHWRKVDAPSGTARLLAQAAARGRGQTLEDLEIAPRHGITGQRPEGGIGFSVMRGGGIVGEHSVVFAAEEEVITLSHSARDRGLFARGALEAAAWTRGRAPGLYGMGDVLGFGS